MPLLTVSRHNEIGWVDNPSEIRVHSVASLNTVMGSATIQRDPSMIDAFLTCCCLFFSLLHLVLESYPIQ
jgi:hypothetical protein